MDLTRPDIVAYKALMQEPGMNITEFMSRTKLSRPRAYSTLRTLESQHLVKAEGRPSRYKPEENNQSAQLSRLLRLYRPYPVATVLSRRYYSLFKQIMEDTKTVRELGETTGLSQSRLYGILTRFMYMGLIVKLRDGYKVSSSHPLYKCLLEYEKTQAPNFELENGGAIIWQNNGEYLVQTDDYKKYTAGLKKPWRFTSTSAVGEYGVNIIPPTTTVYVADQTTPVIESSKGQYTNLEDTIIFTLLHDSSDSKEYTRFLLLLHKDKINIQELRQKARGYKINETLESILYDLKPVMRT
jgi:predicted transcriptional regulator